MKKIIVDIMHPAHLNFFKILLSTHLDNNIQYVVTIIDRGKLIKIAQDELKDVKLIKVGSHKGSLFSIIFSANIFKFFRLYFVVIKEKPDIGLSFGSFVLGAVLKIYGKKNVQFDDDPERKLNLFLEQLTSSELYFPPIFEEKELPRKSQLFFALKEWAYLNPKYFKPCLEVLDNYNLNHINYLFVREVSTSSLNYRNQAKNLIASISSKFPKEISVVLSLEEKNTFKQYPSHWILLKEPVENIHSLIYYSKLVVSSGDSMAREGAMLGVPSIYCGFREMKANQIMIDKGMLFHKNIDEVPEFIDQIIRNKINIEEQDKFREKLKNEWVDVTEFIVNTIKKYQKS